MYVPFIGVGIGIGIECFHLISPCWVIQKRLFLSQILDDSSCAQRSGDGVFVFVNRRCDKMKILFWDRHGFWILFKRLEAGCSRCRGQNEMKIRLIQSRLRIRSVNPSFSDDQHFSYLI